MQLEVGKRYLIKTTEPYIGSTLHEINVIEISPSGKYVNIQYISGYKEWDTIKKFLIIEELGPTPVFVFQQDTNITYTLRGGNV